MNKAANDSARVSGQDRKKLPALGTNQIAGFGGFRPLASLEKNKYRFFKKHVFGSLLLEVSFPKGVATNDSIKGRVRLFIIE